MELRAGPRTHLVELWETPICPLKGGCLPLYDQEAGKSQPREHSLGAVGLCKKLNGFLLVKDKFAKRRTLLGPENIKHCKIETRRNENIYQEPPSCSLFLSLSLGPHLGKSFFVLHSSWSSLSTVRRTETI